MKTGFEKLAKDWGGLLTSISLLLAGFYLHQSLTDRFDKLEAEFKADISRLESEVKADISRLESEFKADISRLDERIFRLALDVRAPQKGTALAERASPITLTPEGEIVAEKIGAKALAEKYADRVEIPDNANKLEIQEASFYFALYDMESTLNQQDKDLLYDAIYEAGATSLDEVFTVFGVLLRDYHLEKRGLEVPKRNPE